MSVVYIFILYYLFPSEIIVIFLEFLAGNTNKIGIFLLVQNVLSSSHYTFPRLKEKDRAVSISNIVLGGGKF